MHTHTCLLLLLGLALNVLCQRIFVPPLLQSCEPTLGVWFGDGKAQNTSDAIVELKTVLPDGAVFTITFTNIGPEGFTFVPIFHPGSQISVLQSGFNATESTVEDSGNSDCVLQFDNFKTESVFKAPPNQTMAFETNVYAEIECFPTNFLWNGGVAPYQLFVESLSSTPGSGPQVSLHIENITGTEVNTTFPLPPTFESDYSINLYDSDGNKTHTTLSVIPSQDEGCLMHQMDLTSSPPAQSASPDSAISSSSSTHKAIVIAIPIIVALLLIGGVSVLASRYLRRRKNLKRLSMTGDRFDDRQYLKLEDVKVQQPAKAYF